jgi:hypothetical protein
VERRVLMLGFGDTHRAKRRSPDLGGLDYILFTVNGNVVFTLGEDAFLRSLDQDQLDYLFPSLISSLRSFSRLFEMDLKMISTVGHNYIYKMILSSQYRIEERVQKDLSQVRLAQHLGIEERPEKLYEGFAIGFEVTRNPFFTDFPEVLLGLELYTLREIADAFFTEFSEEILSQQLHFDAADVEKILGLQTSRNTHFVDIGHPRYQKGLEATVYYTKDRLSMDIHYELADSSIQSDALARIVTTIYASLNELLGFSNNPDREGAIIIDFGGLETLGYSLFAFGKHIEDQNRDALVLSILVGEKEQYYIGGSSEIPGILHELREKTLKKTSKPQEDEEDSKFVKWY